MAGVFLVVIGLWACSWGIHTLFISKKKKRVALASLVAPCGLLLFYSGLFQFV